jgi:uncharacterized protein
MSYVGGLLETPEVQKLNEFTHHYISTRLLHSLNVSYTSYKISKKFGWNKKATARAGLLHDLFYYDWRETKFVEGSHAYVHPRIAYQNAQKLTTISKIRKRYHYQTYVGCNDCTTTL